MSFKFSNLGHFFASIGQEIVHVSKAVAPVVAKIQSSEGTVELLSGLVYPEAVPLERGAYALLGMAAHAVSSAGDAASVNGLSLTLDTELINEIKALIPAMEAYAQQMGIAKPSTTVPAVPITKAVISNLPVATSAVAGK